MKFKQFIVKLLKIDVSPVYTISIADYENSEIAPRASGRTTRLADMYIQLLFSTGGIKVQDHHQGRQSDMFLTKIIVRRLQIEHPRIRFEVRGSFIYFPERPPLKRII